MKRIRSHLPLALTVTVLMAAMCLLANGGPEYCGRSCSPASQRTWALAANAPAPTLAPPQKVVIVQVEADKADLEVGWVED
ncbi:MAG: hypothetical protein ABFC96_17345 [Thermoguttaceae bacterium]